jgi:hypothetical protein
MGLVQYVESNYSILDVQVLEISGLHHLCSEFQELSIPDNVLQQINYILTVPFMAPHRFLHGTASDVSNEFCPCLEVSS